MWTCETPKLECFRALAPALAQTGHFRLRLQHPGPEPEPAPQARGPALCRARIYFRGLDRRGDRCGALISSVRRKSPRPGVSISQARYSHFLRPHFSHFHFPSHFLGPKCLTKPHPWHHRDHHNHEKILSKSAETHHKPTTNPPQNHRKPATNPPANHNPVVANFLATKPFLPTSDFRASGDRGAPRLWSIRPVTTRH